MRSDLLRIAVGVGICGRVHPLRDLTDLENRIIWLVSQVYRPSVWQTVPVGPEQRWQESGAGYAEDSPGLCLAPAHATWYLP